MASQESSSQQSERRARKGKAPMEGPSAHIFKEEDEEVKASHREIIMSKAMKDCFHYVSHQPVTRWNFIDLSCNTPIFNSLWVREKAGPYRRPPPIPQAPRARLLTPSSSSTSPTESPHCRTSFSSSTIPPPSPVMSPHASISSTPVVPPPNDPAPPSSSLFPEVLAHFIKVTNWESMQIFQYQLHFEEPEEDARLGGKPTRVGGHAP
nr:hypothetical protein Iba_scaffold1393CG0700 [Ipomoea batatas]